MRTALEQKYYKIINAGIERVPQNLVSLNPEQLVKFDKMLGMLEDDDDVQAVYHNLKIQD